MAAENPSGEDFRRRAQNLLSRQDAAGALAVAESGLEAYPLHKGLIGLKLNALRRLDQGDAAWAYAQSLPQKARGGPVLAALVDFCIGRGHLEEARTLLREAPQSDHHYLRAASSFAAHTEGPQAALAVFEGREADIGKAPGLAVEYARLLELTGQPEKAAEVLDGAAAQSSASWPALALIRLELDLGRTERADMFLERHAALAKANSGWHMTAIRAAEQAGDPERALARAEAGVSQFPEDTALNGTLWRLMGQTGHRDRAAQLCSAFAEQKPDHIERQLAAARFLSTAKEEELCDTVLERALQSEPDHPDLLRLRAQVLLNRHDAMGAYDLLTGPAARGGARPEPEIEIALAKAEQALGDLPQAIARLETLLENNPGHVSICLMLARLHVLLGGHDRALELLRDVPDSKSVWSFSRYEILTDIALNDGDLPAAREAVETALTFTETNVGLWQRKSRIELFLGHVERAWNSHIRATQLKSDKDVTGQRSRRPRNSIEGQILNEFRLSEPPDLPAVSHETANPRAAMRHFRSCVENNPDSTAPALCLLAALERAGHIRTEPKRPPRARRNRIPNQVFQFWDSVDLPEQIGALMEQNRRLNPGYVFHRFNEAEAFAYLKEKDETQAMRGFRLAPHAAGKADIFRLAVLWHEGGIYLDVDDRCLKPLDDLVDPRFRFIGHQEPQKSIGNNFLAVRRRDPIMRAALDEAVGAFSGPRGESLWLSTGPGAITRAVAQHGTRKDGTFGEGVWIMPVHRLRHSIAPHIHLSYKATGLHWFNQFKKPASPS